MQSTNRIKIALTVLLTTGVALGIGLGARAMPMSAVQDWCTGAGGEWDGWIEFVEEDDGDFESVEFGTCTWYTGTGYEQYGDGDRYVQVYRDGERIRSCTHQGTVTTCDYDKPAPSPTPTPTASSKPQVGTTSGTYQQPAATPTPTSTTTTTRTTTTSSGTYSR